MTYLSKMEQQIDDDLVKKFAGIAEVTLVKLFSNGVYNIELKIDGDIYQGQGNIKDDDETYAYKMKYKDGLFHFNTQPLYESDLISACESGEIKKISKLYHKLIDITEELDNVVTEQGAMRFN